MNSPWFLKYEITTGGNQYKEPYILSCHHRNQTRHYYLIESAALKVASFRFTNLDHIANYLFTKGKIVRLISLLRDYGLFANVSASNIQGKVVYLVIVPKICLKPTAMGVTN